MIVKFKLFENINNKFKIGDYVIINTKDRKNRYESIVDFLDNNVGIVEDFEYDKDIYNYDVKYNNVPDDLIMFTRYMGSEPKNGLKSEGEIFCGSEDELILATKEEIEIQKIKNKSNKYNL